LWIIAGLTLMVISGLSALAIAQSLSNRVEVLVATRDIARGEEITESDLGVASVAATSGVRAIDPAEKDELVGQIATGPIGPGSVVHPAQFVDGATEDANKVLIGLELEPGDFPRFALNPGDEVVVIEVSPSTASADDDLAGPREVGTGEVVEAVALRDADVLLVTLRVNDSIAVSISERAEQDRIRLALVDRGFPEDLVEPLEPADPVEPATPEGDG
jgi:hypothetical protein